jgi:hypothetical protein
VFDRNTAGVEEEDEEVDNDVNKEEPPRQYSALCTTINGERFRILLLRLFIYCQLPYNLIEHSEFRDLLQYIQPSIGKFLPKRTAIGEWVADEFAKGKKVIKVAISKAKSRVHISFDIWTSP